MLVSGEGTGGEDLNFLSTCFTEVFGSSRLTTLELDDDAAGKSISAVDDGRFRPATCGEEVEAVKCGVGGLGL